jgi:hypothetical protein
MNSYDIVGWGIIIASILLIWHCPIFKPYFGFWRK